MPAQYSHSRRGRGEQASHAAEFVRLLTAATTLGTQKPRLSARIVSTAIGGRRIT
jgi:hypothetical protein